MSLAAVGTTLPETWIPIIAIYFGSGQGRAVGVRGAILGAPFHVKRPSCFRSPCCSWCMPGWENKLANLEPNFKESKTNIVFFLLAYGLALK